MSRAMQYFACISAIVIIIITATATATATATTTAPTSTTTITIIIITTTTTTTTTTIITVSELTTSHHHSKSRRHAVYTQKLSGLMSASTNMANMLVNLNFTSGFVISQDKCSLMSQVTAKYMYPTLT